MPTTTPDVLIFALKFLVATLAVYRLAFEIAAREGPFSIFYRFRTWATNTGSRWLEEWVTCAACQSLWIALLAVLVGFPGLSIGWFILTWIGISGACTVVHFWLIGLK